MADQPVPLHDAQTQGWTISAALKKPAYRLQMVRRLQADDFIGIDRRLFEAIAQQDAHGKFDILAFQKALGGPGDLAFKRFGAIEGEFLAMPDQYAYDDWIKTILAYSERRSASNALQLAIGRLKKNEPVEAVIGDLVTTLSRGRRAADNDTLVSVEQGVFRVAGMLARWEGGDIHVDTVPTGFAALDRVLGGLCRKNVTVLAARPGIGKTQLALQITRNVALRIKSLKRDAVAIVFSAEMSMEQCIIRLAQAASGVPKSVLRDNTATPEQKAQFNKALDLIRDLPILVDETPAPTTAQMFIRIAVEAMLHKDGVDLVVFDYLELAGDKGGEREEARLGEIMRGLKIIAKHFNCPVLVLSQLNRKVEERPSKRPESPDLRSSGWVEALSQQIIMLTRPDYYATETGGQLVYQTSELRQLADRLGPNAAIVDITKNRDDSTGTVVLRFAAPITLFYEDAPKTQAKAAPIKPKATQSSFVAGRDDPGQQEAAR
jgi:replicative DNA helicase